LQLCLGKVAKEFSMPNNNPQGHNQYTRSQYTGSEDRGAQNPHPAAAQDAANVPLESAQDPATISAAASNSAAPSRDTRTGERRSGTSRRGFASMDQQTQREIASKGGHSQGRDNNPGNFANDRDKARTAGRKGGEASGSHR
jgi:general stress protein YciG